MLEPLIVIPARAQGQIGAGKVVDFLPLNKHKWIPLPKNAKTSDRFDDYEICGESLEGIGIFDGMSLTCRTTFEISDIKPHKVCIVLLLHTNEQTAKMVQINHQEETVTLIGANPNYKSTTYFYDEIQILAIADEVRRKI